MRIREVLIEDDKTIADSGTETIDIKVKDWITELVVDFSLTNDTEVARNVPPQKAISKIELVDGGKTYWSLTGQEAVAAAAFDKGRMPPSWLCEVNSAEQRIAIPIIFGRYLADPLFGFNPTRLVNPQLKVTWAKDTLHLAGSLKLGVWAKVMEDIAAPSKALFWKTVESFMSVAGGTKKVDLPVDYPYRRVGIRAYQYHEIMESCLTKFKMDCDVGKFIPFELEQPEFSDICRQMFGPFQYHKCDVAGIDSDHEAWIGGNTIGNPVPETFGVMIRAWLSGCSYYVLRAQTHAGVDVDGQRCQILITGDFPECTWGYQFGRKDDELTWFPAKSYGDIDLILTQGVTGGACSVFLQQPRTLP